MNLDEVSKHKERLAAEAELEDLLSDIAKLRPLLRENGVQGEKDRRVLDASLQALKEVGALRVSTLKRFGGYELGHGAAMRVGREVARGDGGTAWVVSLLNSGAWYTRHFSEQVQEEIFGSDPDTLVSAVVAPTGVAKQVAGGYELTGQWAYNSGAWHADWALVAVRLEGPQGESLGEGQVLLPASDYWIEDVWRVAGMRSSGSNLLVADGAFVPDYRAIVTQEAGQLRDREPSGTPEYRAASVPLALLGPQLGLGRAMLDAVVTEVSKRGVAYTEIQRRADWVPFQLDVARAAQMLDTADLFAESAAAYLDEVDETADIDYLARARVRGDVGWAVENVTEAIRLLLSAAGAAAFAENNHMQRSWRDQAVVARHGYVSPPLSLEVYGKALLGVDNTTSVLL